MAQQIELHKLSEIELKAIAYDLIAQSEAIQRNLAMVNQMIAKRAQEATSVTEESEAPEQEVASPIPVKPKK